MHLTQFSELTLMRLSGFKNLQVGRQLIISMICNLYQEFSKTKKSLVDSNFAFFDHVPTVYYGG